MDRLTCSIGAALLAGRHLRPTEARHRHPGRERDAEAHQVDFVCGITWSNVMLVVQPLVNGAGKIMVGTNAGANPLAGKQCNELYFTTFWNDEQCPMRW